MASPALSRCGIDEAGRGALAGPVVVACVGGLPVAEWTTRIRDSKKMTPRARQQVAELIKKECAFVETSWISPKEVDRLNVLHATLRGMADLATSALDAGATRVIVDGHMAPTGFENDARVEPLVKADHLVKEVAAASIVAKTERDTYMASIGDKNFSHGKHKGYGTAQHYEEIARSGPSAHHRRSFHLGPTVRPACFLPEEKS